MLAVPILFPLVFGLPAGWGGLAAFLSTLGGFLTKVGGWLVFITGALRSVLIWCFSLKGFITLGITWLVAELIGFGEAFQGFLIQLTNTVLGWVVDFAIGERGVVWMLLDSVLPLVINLLAQLPGLENAIAPYQGSITMVMGWVWGLNLFLPVAEAFALLSIYVSLLIVVFTFKGIMKLLPGYN
jgi:hypothetical protein